MKLKMTLGLCCFAFMALQAQSIQVVNRTQVHNGYYPVLSADGTHLLLTTENYVGLSVVDVQNQALRQLTNETNAGYQPLFSADNAQVFYRTKTMSQGRGYLSVKAHELTTQKERVLLSPRREVGKLEQYDNGVVFSQQKQLRKATFGDTKATIPAYVSNEELKLVLYKNGKRTELYPHGTEVNYVWSSISPDGTMILFNTKLGTAICDLKGVILMEFGHLNAPVWYNNHWVLGMLDTDDGHTVQSSAILMASVDGKKKQTLTSNKEIAMYPSAASKVGKIAYNTLNGEVYIMEIVVR